jgi:hypothetical protein
MSRASYSLVIASLVDALLRSLIISFVLSIRSVFEDQLHWPRGVGFGAVCAFSVTSVFAAFVFGTSKRLAPINTLRFAVAMIFVFAFLIMAVEAHVPYVGAYMFLGMASTTGSVLIWWIHGQHTQTLDVLRRFSIVSALSNIPLAILATLMHTQATFTLIAASASIFVALVTIICLQQRVYSTCFKVPVPAATEAWAPGYGPSPAERVYDDERHAYALPTTTTTTVAATEPTLSLPQIQEEDKREMQQFVIEDEDDKPETNSEAGRTEVSRSTRGPEELKFRAEASSAAVSTGDEELQPIQPPTADNTTVTPDKRMQERLDLWMGGWTCVAHGTLEALIFYNVSGWSGIGAPWYVTSVAVGCYSALIAIGLSSWLKTTATVEHGSSYRAWYKYAVILLLLYTIVHALLEMSPWATFYVPHVVLSLFYMPALSLAASLPLFRAYELCHMHKFSFNAVLPRWFLAVTLGRAVAYVFEYLVLYADAQMLGNIVLCLINVITYNAVRRDELGVAF